MLKPKQDSPPPQPQTSGSETGMQTHLKIARPPRRSAWRQSLVEAERGFARGFRGDSTLFAHFFGICLIVVTSLVLGLGLIQWAMVILALTIALAAELFYLMLKAFALRSEESFERDTSKHLMQMGTAALLVCLLGTGIVVLLVFVHSLKRSIGP